MSAKKEAIPATTLATYDKLIEKIPGIERKGASMPYTSVNGNMFSFITKEGTLALRLSAEDRELFMKKHNAGLCEQHGTVLKEYVAVPDAMMKASAGMHKYFLASYEYTSGLKPKPPKTKK